MFITLTTYPMTYLFPLILNQGLGFSGAMTLLLSTPPYGFAFCLAMTFSWMSDRMRVRSPFIIYLCVQPIVGLILMRWGANVGARYLGIFFAVGGTTSNASFTLGFGQNNTPTRVSRRIVSRLQLSIGAIGGIIGSLVFRSQDAPTYTPGLVTAMCCVFYVLVTVCYLMWYLHRSNKNADRTGQPLAGQVGFRYTL
jgi:hypothetical protein